MQEIVEKGSVRPQTVEQSDTEDEEQRDLGGDWLTSVLPSLPHFSAALPKLCHLLLQACLVETNLHCLLSYLLFLTQHATREASLESSIAISQIIVDRFEVIRKLFKKPAGDRCHGSDRASDPALTLLLKMFRNSLEAAVHRSRGTPKSPSGADFVPVTLPGGDVVVLHSALIHATFLLLTCDSPRNPDDYNFLMDVWFPSDAVLQPEIYSAVTPDPILSYLLSSSSLQVLRVAVELASPLQLCAFIQSFGTPLSSVQSVLTKLDELSESTESQAQLREVTADPKDLCQHIEVLFLRGATSGRKFLAFVQTLADLPQEVPETDVTNLFPEVGVAKSMYPTPTTCTRAEIPSIPQEEMEQLLLQIFAPSLSRAGSPNEEVKTLTSDLESGLRALAALGHTTIIDNSDSSPVNSLTAALHKMVTSSSVRRQFLLGMARSRFAISLLRLITKIHLREEFSGTTLKATLQYILTNMDSSKISKNQPLSVAFQAVVTSCAEQVGLKPAQMEVSQLQKLERIARKACKEVRLGRNPFESESLLRNCQYLVESKTPLLEGIVYSLVKLAITLRRENRCIEHLHKLQAFSRANVPIAMYCSPEIFEMPESRSKSPGDDSSLEAADTSASPWRELSPFSIAGPPNLDLNGLLVDCLELLDPDILSVCQTSAAREMAFGSNLQELAPRERGGGGSASLLLSSGQGYLLARLTHESSWPTILCTISSLLDSVKLKEW